MSDRKKDKKKKDGFPKEIKEGSTIVKVYKTPSRGCDLFTVVHYVGKTRVRAYFADLEKAMQDAQVKANSLSKGEIDVLELRSQDRIAYVHAVEALKPTGVPLEIAAMQYAEVFPKLNGVSLREMVEFYRKYHPNNAPQRLVEEVVKEFCDGKDLDGVSEVYTKDLRSRLGRFERSFLGRKISLVTMGEIEDFLRDLKTEPDKRKKNQIPQPLSGRSKNNYRRAIGSLLGYAEARGYVPKGIMEMDDVSLAKEDEGDIEFFSLEEMKRILAHTEPALIPFMAIGAFAGLRHSEIARLDWREVRLEEGFIEVKARKTKTASRRLVPITPNLKAWLKDYKKDEGEVCPYASMSKQLVWIAEAVDAAWKKEDPEKSFVWKHNALRHSFITYRVAQVQNVAQVALESGNSPKMIFSHYRGLVRPTDAEEWFGIMPTSAQQTA